MNLLQFFTIGALFFAPMGEKFEGNYAQYLRAQRAVVTVWGEHVENVIEVARNEGFEVTEKSNESFVIVFSRNRPDLRLYLERLGWDAGIDSIRPDF